MIRSLVKTFDGVRAVDGLDLEIKDGEFVTLLGPSGCGKTTTLRCLAGLEAPTSGEITVGGTPFSRPTEKIFVPPERRHVGMVFQSYALWPHMTVRGNVEYPLKLARVPKEERRRRAEQMLARVGLAGRERVMPGALSGGQQQRVALARAMVSDPALLLFDEPLSNLDAKLRYTMRNEIRDLHDSLGTTSVYVTHDQEEAIALSDRIVVMNAGRSEQIGTPQELYTEPASRFVADFMGFQNIVDGVVRDGRVHCDDLEIAVTGVALPGGSPVAVAFRAAHVQVNPPDTEGVRWRGTVRHATYLGSAMRLLIDVGGTAVRAQVDETDFARLGHRLPDPGEQIEVVIRPDHAVVLHAG